MNARLLATCLLIMGASGCSNAPPAADAGARPVWPAPPEPARFVHEASLYGNRDVEPEGKEQRLKRVVAGDSRPDFKMTKPFGITARDGRIYVSDSLARVVHVFDLPRRRFFRLGFRFEGKLQKPTGLTTDERGNLYVADAKAKRIVVFDGLGLYVKALGGPEELDHPTAVSVTPRGERIYVVDTGGVDSQRHRVVVYNPEGQIVQTIGERGHGEGQFNLPVDAALGPDGRLYVLDAGNFRVQVFGADGRFERAWGSVGSGFGQFARPRAIAVDGAGLVYVSDASFANIQVFDPQGQLLLPIGNKHIDDGPGRFALPAGLATDDKNYIYVVDQFFNKVEVLRRLTDEPGPKMQASR